MDLVEFESSTKHPIERFGSLLAHHIGIARIDGSGGVGLIVLDAGGILGRHPAVVDQLFIVIQGEGWVAGADGRRFEVEAGHAARFEAGENHESGTASGMTALVVEAALVELR